MENTRDFQIALLIDDIQEAKKISDGLRQIGIFAHYYQDLDDLWVSLNTYTPDLCIVDVKKMSQKNLLFKQHPKVKNNTLKYVFYYKNSTQILLNSTNGLAHYGLIRAELDINNQLRAIVKRRQDELELAEQNSTLMSRIERLKLRSHNLTQNVEKSRQKLGGVESVMKLMAEFGEVSDAAKFKSRMVNMLTGWEACETFGFYELNSTGQKLVSPQARGTKLNSLPDLWLTNSCDNGIENYALEMAFDVTYGVIGDDAKLVRVFGKSDKPEIALFIQTTENVSSMALKYLEDSLTSAYRKILLSHQKPTAQAYQQDLFDILHSLDEQQFYKVKTDHRFVLVDFSNLVGLIRQRSGNRFYWKNFFSEFTSETVELLGENTIVSNYGAEYFLVGIDKNVLDVNYNKLKAYTEDFQYWRYFEDSTFVVGNDVAPSVRFISPSSVSLLRNVQDGVQDIMTKEPKSVYDSRLEV